MHFAKIKQNSRPKRIFKKRFNILLILIFCIFIFTLISVKRNNEVHAKDHLYTNNSIGTSDSDKVRSTSDSDKANGTSDLDKASGTSDSDKANLDLGPSATGDSETSNNSTIPSSPDKTDASDSSTYGKSVKSTKAVDNSYFDDACFIGDSRTEGFIVYNNLVNAAKYAAKGLNINTIFTKPIVKKKDGTSVTVIKDLKTKQYKKVYIMFGFNELGWPYESVFIDKYKELIDIIKKDQPDAQIYIQSILPVSKNKSDQDKWENNGRINKYNELLHGLANDCKVYYVNVREMATNDDGVLFPNASTDGVHLNKKYCVKWLEYLKSHTVPLS